MLSAVSLPKPRVIDAAANAANAAMLKCTHKLSRAFTFIVALHRPIARLRAHPHYDSFISAASIAEHRFSYYYSKLSRLRAPLPSITESENENSPFYENIQLTPFL